MLIVVGLVMCMCISLQSCSNDADSNVTNLPLEDEYVEIPLRVSVNADIDVSDEPMIRAGKKTVYVIEVQEKEANTSDARDYAYGIFESVDNVKVRLSKLKKYLIRVALYYDFFDKYDFRSNNVTYGSYTETFVYLKEDEWFYGLSNWYKRGSKDIQYVIEGDGYCNQIEFSPSSSQTCSIELGRVASALEVTVDGLKQGKVQCALKSPHGGEGLVCLLTPDNTTLSQIFVYKDMVDYYETGQLQLYVDYISVEGEKTRLIYGGYIFTRNMKKKIYIKITEQSDEGNIDSGFNISCKEEGFIDEEEEKHDYVV